MGISVTVDEELLSAAEKITRIHDRALLVEEALRALCRGAVPAAFDFDATLRAADSLPDLSDEEFESLGREMNANLPPAW